MTGDDQRHRPQFYGRRHGRKLRPGQRRLLDDELARRRVELPVAGSVDLAALFGGARTAWELEIGFGAGEHLAARAAADPASGFVGCEAYVNGIARLLDHLVRDGLDNVRIWPDDARLLLPALPADTFRRIYVLFPDPWPKARHAGRRLIGRCALDAFARLLVDGGELRVASDDMGYVRWTLRHVLDHPDFAWPARGPADWRRPDEAAWPATRYERKALAGGAKPLYLRFLRRPRHR